MVDMKIALLGATGFVGQVAARELSRRSEIRELLLVDYNIREAKKFAKSLSPKCRWGMADVGRVPDLARLLENVDAVANAVGPCSEYEKTVLLTCAGTRTAAASIGDGVLGGDDRREIHDAFRRAGTRAVSGCGLLPGWTDLLATHFLPATGTKTQGTDLPREGKFLFCSLDRFGGYAFFRRVVRGIGPPASPPPCGPSGRYFETGKDTIFGLPGGKPARLCKGIAGGLGILGTVGRELSSAFLFWLRRSLRPPTGAPAAAAGVFHAEEGGHHFAAISDPEGRIAGTLLAETALILGREGGTGKGLLPLPDIIGRAEAERIAACGGGEIRVG